MRLIDEYRFGLREMVVDDIRALVEAWGDLNRGETPSEVALRLMSRLK